MVFVYFIIYFWRAKSNLLVKFSVCKYDFKQKRRNRRNQEALCISSTLLIKCYFCELWVGKKWILINFTTWSRTINTNVIYIYGRKDLLLPKELLKKLETVKETDKEVSMHLAHHFLQLMKAEQFVQIDGTQYLIFRAQAPWGLRGNSAASFPYCLTSFQVKSVNRIATV